MGRQYRVHNVTLRLATAWPLSYWGTGSIAGILVRLLWDDPEVTGWSGFHAFPRRVRNHTIRVVMHDSAVHYQ